MSWTVSKCPMSNKLRFIRIQVIIVFINIVNLSYALMHWKDTRHIKIIRKASHSRTYSSSYHNNCLFYNIFGSSSRNIIWNQRYCHRSWCNCHLFSNQWNRVVIRSNSIWNNWFLICISRYYTFNGICRNLSICISFSTDNVFSAYRADYLRRVNLLSITYLKIGRNDISGNCFFNKIRSIVFILDVLNLCISYFYWAC